LTGDIFLAFLRLGLTSFGGPVAHLGYFRTEFVARRRWLDEAGFAELVGLCQFLPGPASSQTGFAVGLLRGGLLGGLAAWAGFTLPSALAMTAFAWASGDLASSAAGGGVLHGLKLVAVAIVAQAVWGMARTLCPDRPRAGIALAAVALVTFVPVAVGQITAIAMGAAAGMTIGRETSAVNAVPLQLPLPVSRRLGIACLLVFATLLALPPLLGARVFAAFYRSGALVFGGGHVVLPLLRDAVVGPGWIGGPAFMAGYGAAQAMPGPLFTFAAYLGALLNRGPGGIAGAGIALVAIFLPGLLLVGVLPFWGALRRHKAAWRALRGVNASVVGVLAAALYNPVWTGAVLTPADFCLAASGFVLLTVWRAPPLAVVALGALGGYALAATGRG
jgi:chromate transporter